jgi:radical SAM protein with 4Fe4S-binding SPASM domain
MPSQSVYVFYDGRVFPCCHPYSHQKMQMGDLRTQSFGEIWNGRDYRNLRAGMRTGDVPSICTNCSSAHDPPRVYEDPDQVLAGPSLAEHYAERDLDPLDGRDPLTLLETSGLAGYAQDLQRHADALEEERAHLVGHIANLEAERPHLVGHIANLERERAKPWLRRAPLVRWLARVVQNPRSER